MALWQDANGNPHDDDSGRALGLPSWPKGLKQLTAPSAPTLAQAQAVQIAELTASYNNAIRQPVSYMGATFQADAASQDALHRSLMAMNGQVPADFCWVDASNNEVAINFTQLQGLATVMGAQYWAAFQHLQAQKAAIRTATNVAAVQAIVW